MPRHSLRPHCAAHQIEPLTIAAVVGSWFAAGLAAGITIPVNFNDQVPEKVITSIAVVVMLIPLLISAPMLDERPAFAILTTPRRLHRTRFTVALTYTVQALLGAALVTWMAPVPRSLVIADAGLLVALIIIGFSVFGPARGWLPATLIVAVASAPHLVPIKHNLIYATQHIRVTTALATIGLFLALVWYAAKGVQARPRDETIW